MTTTSPGIDLHAHTTASDGTLTPTELVHAAQELGLAAIGVTDHDTIAGIQEAVDAGSTLDIDVVPGVELSVEDGVGRFHMLGYFFDPRDEDLANALTWLRETRVARNAEIARKAEELGLPITWDDIVRQAPEGSGVIGRPHIAKALVAAGVVGSIAEAFDKYLAPRRPLYSPKEGLDPARAAKLLHDAGGVAIMAHPGLGKWAAPDALRGRLAGLADVAAIDGVECYYSQHTAEQTHAYVEIASSLNLLVSGGSDFHGATKPHVPLGVVFQGRPLPAQVLADLRNGARHRKVVPAEL